jgi:phospholipid transport system substrate-binding protein
MSNVKRSIKLALAALFSFLAIAIGTVTTAYAHPACDVVKAKQTALFQSLKQNNTKAVGGIFDEMLDYDALAQASLGPEWGARSDAEKAEFTGVLKQLVQKAYERNLRKTLDFTIQYLGEDTANGATTCKTKAVSNKDSRAEPLEINYKMVQVGSSWKVQDIITDGMSLVSNWRTQFTKIIKKDGFPALIKKMKDKLAKNEE